MLAWLFGLQSAFRTNIPITDMMKISTVTCAILMGMATLLPAQIKLGAIYCGNGTQKVLDAPSALGARIAVDEANHSGGIAGKKVELIAITPESSMDSVKKSLGVALEKNPDISALVGLSDTDLVMTAGHLAEKRGLPFVTSGATSPKLPNALGSRFFLACFGDNVQAAASAQWLREAKSCRTVAVLLDPEFAYTRLLADYFSKAFRAVGGKITSRVSFSPGTDFKITPEILKSDAIFLATETPRDALPVIKRLRSLGYPGPVVGGDGWDAPAFWKNQPLAADVFFTTHAFPAKTAGAASPAMAKTFRERYKKISGGMEPDSFSALGYDATRLLLQSIKAAAGTNPQAITNALQNARLSGVTGEIRFAKGVRVPSKPVSIIAASAPHDSSLQVIPTMVPTP